jgi:hypothetical protein
MSDGLLDPERRARLLREITPDQAAEQHALVRSIFAAEIDDRRRQPGGDEYFENLYWCAYLLYLVGDPSDVPMMWQAKYLDFDTACGFDVQFMLGAGSTPTLEYLRGHGHEDIAAQLSTCPELADDLEEWAQFRREYFYPASQR